jgi:hypothetical protein
VTDTHAFTAMVQTWSWSVPLLTKSLREFEYRFDVIHVDGSTTAGSWLRSTETALNVGSVAARMWDIEVVPALLDMTKWKLVLVKLTYTDPASGQEQTESIQFTPASSTTEPFVWRVALSDASATSYTYQVQAFGVDGTKKVVGPTTSSDEQLVIDL